MSNRKRKTLQELTIKDNFMFGAVMADEENCRLLLERILGFAIERVETSKEKSILYHPEYRGIRLDIYARDENHTCYNVEMQAVNKMDLDKRSRYYHSQMDMDLLLSGEDYTLLSDAYVIFICDFDPFEQKKYRYTFAQTCREIPGLELRDGSVSIFLSTKGENEGEVPVELVRFLKFVEADLEASERDFDDSFVKRLQDTICNIKSNREMETRYMFLFEQTLKEEWKQGHSEGKAEGKAESILEILSDYGEVSSELQLRVFNETDLEVLRRWLKLAAKVDSIEQFIVEM